MGDLFEPLESKGTVKAAGAFRTISEVAQDLDVPQHVLRFWESKFTQVKPLKRGGGRRYYRPEDVAILRRIRQCLYDEGYTIKGVQRLLKEGGLKAVVSAGALAPAEPKPARVAPAATAAPSNGESRELLGQLREELVELRDMLARGTGA